MGGAAGHETSSGVQHGGRVQWNISFNAPFPVVTAASTLPLIERHYGVPFVSKLSCCGIYSNSSHLLISNRNFGKFSQFISLQCGHLVYPNPTPHYSVYT